MQLFVNGVSDVPAAVPGGRDASATPSGRAQFEPLIDMIMENKFARALSTVHNLELAFMGDLRQRNMTLIDRMVNVSYNAMRLPLARVILLARVGVREDGNRPSCEYVASGGFLASRRLAMGDPCQVSSPTLHSVG